MTPDEDAITPADLFTPHGTVPVTGTPEPPPEPAVGLADPRALPVPDVLKPVPMGLPLPHAPTPDESGRTP